MRTESSTVRKMYALLFIGFETSFSNQEFPAKLSGLARTERCKMASPFEENKLIINIH